MSHTINVKRVEKKGCNPVKSILGWLRNKSDMWNNVKCLCFMFNFYFNVQRSTFNAQRSTFTVSTVGVVSIHLQYHLVIYSWELHIKLWVIDYLFIACDHHRPWSPRYNFIQVSSCWNCSIKYVEHCERFMSFQSSLHKSLKLWR